MISHSRFCFRSGVSTSPLASAVLLIAPTPINPLASPNSAALVVIAAQPGPLASPHPPVVDKDMEEIRPLIEQDMIKIIMEEAGNRFTTDEAQKVSQIPASLMG